MSFVLLLYITAVWEQFELYSVLLLLRWVGFPLPTWKRRTDFCWLNDIYSKLTTSTELHAAHSLSAPCKSDLFDKTQRLGLKRKRQCPQKPSLALWRTLTRSRCQITDSRSIAPYLAPLQPCLPPRPTGKCVCCSQITLRTPYPVTLSYYW